MREKRCETCCHYSAFLTREQADGENEQKLAKFQEKMRDYHHDYHSRMFRRGAKPPEPYWPSYAGGRCLRYPKPESKGPDEWCGEWEAK